MDIRYAANPRDAKHYTTEQLREEFHISNVFRADEINMVYSHVDRVITGSAVPVSKTLELVGGKELSSEYFLERREIGIINIGGKGTVSVDGTVYELNTNDGLYVGLGNKEILFASQDAATPAKFYFNSTPAHKAYPTEKIDIASAEPARLGTQEECNRRTIYKYIHPMGVKSCQLVMGMTILEPGSIWNTMPCHTHERRMEVYLYFNMQPDSVVFHLMGQPTETRHIVMRNEEAVISPSWSIHSGCGTRNYTFIWGMGGENQVFGDMDGVGFDTIM